MNVDERIFQALTYLGETDEELAALKEKMLRMEERHKQIMAAEYKVAEGNIETRKATARIKAAPAYTDYLAAVREHDAMNNKRKTETIVVEVCRSLKADRRHGNVT